MRIDLSRSFPVLLSVVMTACAPQVAVPPSLSEPAVGPTGSALPDHTTTTQSEIAVMVSGLTVGSLEPWSRLGTSAVEWGDVFPTLDGMIDNISVAIIGEITGPPVQRVFDDPETDDSFGYLEVPVEVVVQLGGIRQVRPGETLTVVWIGSFPEELIGDRNIWFLMNARDGDTVDRYPNEPDAYRLSNLAVWVDRGDGVPVAPISETERKPDGMTLDEFVFDDTRLPDPTFHGAELEARSMTMDEFITYILERSGTPE